MKLNGRLNDLQVKELTDRFISCGDHQALERIDLLLAAIIWNYPRKFRGYTEDDSASFYEFVRSALPSILASYKRGQTLFLTWFFVVLRSRYLNWLRAQKDEIVQIPAEEEGKEGVFSHYDQQAFALWRTGSEQKETDVFNIEDLPEGGSDLVRLLFFDLAWRELSLILNKQNRSLNGRLFSLYMRERACVRARYVYWQDRLRSLRERIRITPNKTGKDRLQEVYSRTEQRFYKARLHISLETAAVFLGCSQRMVKKKLHDLRIRIRKKT